MTYFLKTNRQFWKGVAVALMTATLFWGCYRQTPVKKTILSPEEMAPILKDIHLAEAWLIEARDRREKDSLARFYYAQIFALHRVDSAVFGQSLDAYFTDPHALDSLYRDVIQLLEAERKRIGVPSPSMDPMDNR